MFERPHHQRIARILEAFDARLLADAECYFGGGTAIVMALGEYRESVDIDFLCASSEGYRSLRNAVSNDLGRLLKQPLVHLREVRTDQYKIYTFLEIDATPVKVELVREARVSIHGEMDPDLKVPVLSRSDLYTQKLLANADWGLDRSVLSRDIIDLAMMIQGWGTVPREAWDKAYQAYGDHLHRAFQKSVGMVSDPAYLAGCLRRMHMDERLASPIISVLDRTAASLPLNDRDAQERRRRIRHLSDPDRCTAGAALVFWQQASEAMKADAPDDVDWAVVESKTIRQCIARDGLPPQSVIDVITQHSPGAASPERQTVIARNVERLAERIQNRFECGGEECA